MISHINADTTYALNYLTNRIVHISDVQRGLACNCICPMCKNPMIANKGDHNQHYFSHERKSGIQYNAQLCQEVTMHRVAEQIITDKKKVMLPSYFDICEAFQIEFVNVEVEERKDRPDIQPDIVGITSDGKRYLIEIKLSHAVDDEKKKKIYSDNLTCVEIDISQQKMDDLEDFLLNKTYDREWINNKYEFESIVDTYKNKGRDVRIMHFNECKARNNSEKCSSCVNSTIMHCGSCYVICDSVSGCRYTEKDIWKGIYDEVYEKPTREERKAQTYFTSLQPKYIPSHTRTDIGDENNYLCHPGNSVTTLEDYYKRIIPNKIFYKKGEMEYSILNHWQGKNRFGVVLVQKNEQPHFYYVIVSQSNGYIHKWSIRYLDENTATFTLKNALGIKE